MSIQDARLAEYTLLRQEVIHSIQINVQIAVTSLPITAGVIVYGYQTSNPLAFLTAIVVLFSSKLLIGINTSSILSIGAYIASIIETKEAGLKWETLLFQGRRKDSPFLPLAWLTVVIYNAISILCGFLAWNTLPNYFLFNLEMYRMGALLLILGLIIVSAFSVYVSTEKYFLIQVKKWKDVEKEVQTVKKTFLRL